MSKQLKVATLAVSALCAGALAAGSVSASAEPGAHASVALTPCDLSGKQQTLGASYVTSLKVLGVSCTKGEHVVKAYHACRHANGGAGGKCSSKVLGFSCKESGRQEVPNVQYSATMKCRKGAKRVKSSYTQNT
jgi:hypothetical protein